MFPTPSHESWLRVVEIELRSPSEILSRMYCSHHQKGNLKVYKCLQIYWEETFNIRADFSHKFAAEKVPEKQQFLMKEYGSDLPVLYEDVTHCHKISATNLVTGGNACVPPCRKLTAGFSCTSKSPLNNNRAQNKACIQQGVESSGLTFAAVCDTVKAISPDEVMLENLKSLECVAESSDVSDKEWIVQWFNENGYDAAWFRVEANEFGSLACRLRMYLLAYKGERGSHSARLSYFQTFGQCFL